MDVCGYPGFEVYFDRTYFGGSSLENVGAVLSGESSSFFFEQEPAPKMVQYSTETVGSVTTVMA